MKKFILVILLFFGIVGKAQNLTQMASEIKEEALEIYRSEMASWYGTDVLREQYPDIKNIGGYFSYIDGKIPKNIFFSKENKVIATISFPNGYHPKDALLDKKERKFTSTEEKFFILRNNAMTRIENDTIFKFYKDVNYNIVPIIYKNTKKVYVLSASNQNNRIIFGNDYVMSFDGKDNVKEVKKLHNSLLTFSILDEDGKVGFGGMHSHLIDDFQAITVTDLCTLMLYQHLTQWKYYATVSKKYLSFWDTEKEELTIVPNTDKNFEDLKNKVTGNKK